jgi:hypothetical protein
MPEQRDRFIPQRKSDVVTGLVASGTLAGNQEASLRQFARVLGAIIHHQHFEQLDRLRDMYFYFDPEVGAEARRPARDLEKAYCSLSGEFVRLLIEANFVEIPREVISRAFGEHALVRVKIKAPVEEYRDVRMFRRGDRKKMIEIPEWFGLRRRKLEIAFYDDVVLMVATASDTASTAEPRN